MSDMAAIYGDKECEGTPLPSYLSQVNTPLKVAAWEEALQDLPDRECAAYVLRGLKEGFRIGFTERQQHRSAKKNMLSAEQNPTVVDQYLGKERASGRVVLVSPQDATTIHINRFGVIPKNHQPGKWRLILDLSYPKGASINDGVKPELCSLTYTSVETAARQILEWGPGTLLAKLDIESAYRIIPVHPRDRSLLGMRWKGETLVDTSLPFGLRSAPKIFNLVADCLQWILEHKGTRFVIHYLDDFLLAGRPGTAECGESLQQALAICAGLGVPIAEKKLEGPTRQLQFLGIEMDTEKMELRLPQDKLERLQRTILQWRSKQSCTKRELLSIIGQLQHACKVVRPGRTFLRRMIELSTVAKELYHHIRLNKGFRSDLEWWAAFLPQWNGIEMLSSVCRLPHSVEVTADASGGWGCGGFSSENEWFQVKWPKSWMSSHITIKELLPLVLACALWGNRWRGKTVLCRSDNAAAVAAINSGRSKAHDPTAMHLLRSAFFFMARDGYCIRAVHVAGRLNVAADALSRDNLPLFFAQVPRAHPHPSKIPDELYQLLVHERPDWTSQSWRDRFSSSLPKV